LIRRLALFIVQVAAAAIFCCLVFFGVLTIWGLTLGPFVILQSASFVIVCSLVVSAAVTVLAFGWVYRRLKRRHPENMD
jgi:uncharacterized BrkB/YihY/UPF0761 family membrane protein